VLVAEIGDVHRFRFRQPAVFLDRAEPAALRGRHRRPPGHVTKQDSKLVRWAVVEAIQRKTAVLGCRSFRRGAEPHEACDVRPARSIKTATRRAGGRQCPDRAPAASEVLDRVPATYHRTHGVRYFHGCYSVGDDLWGVDRRKKAAANTLATLKSIRAARPDGAPVYVILDNLSAHKGTDIRR